MAATILIVDDERNILLTLNQALQFEGYHTELASSGQLALDTIAAKPVDAVLMDVKMPDMDGLAALEKIKAIKPDLPIVMMSGHGTIDTAVRATQLGARDFLEKPISRERLLVALRNALQHRAMVEELAELRAEVGQFEMVGTSPAMERLYQLIRRIAPSEGWVLITGENGSGKELVARAIHQHSQRRKGPFVKLNCAAVPEELIESELFGHERGAFTGALSVRRGKFELAHEGSLFLDEVGDMPPAMQAKLLRVLQEGEFERVGGSETFKVDVRVIAASNKNLEQEIAAGRFREDLYYRLNVVHLHCPPCPGAEKSRREAGNPLRWPTDQRARGGADPASSGLECRRRPADWLNANPHPSKSVNASSRRTGAATGSRRCRSTFSGASSGCGARDHPRCFGLHPR